MENPEEENNIEMPGDNSNETGHSVGFYEVQPEPSEENLQPDAGMTEPKPATGDEDIKKIVKRKTIFAFSIFGLMTFVIIGGLIWLFNRPAENELGRPFRTVLGINEKVNKVFFKSNNLAPTYPVSKADKNPRVNGDAGMDTSFKVADWQLYIVNVDKKDTMVFNMDSIKKLPKTEICFNFKCIEGWSQVTHWGGVRFIDFVNYYRLATHSGKPIDPEKTDDLAQYAGFQTPDDEYYVGLDIASALHPQTLLCYEMNGKPLPYDQGAPLRLIVPVKYGIKSLKRIGLIYFSDKRPADYWFERGYDYDAAL